MKLEQERIHVQQETLYDAFDAYIHGFLLEKSFEELNISIIHNQNYDALSNYPYVVCVEILCDLCGFECSNDKMFDLVGKFLVTTAMKAIKREKAFCGKELLDLTLINIRTEMIK